MIAGNILSKINVSHNSSYSLKRIYFDTFIISILFLEKRFFKGADH